MSEQQYDINRFATSVDVKKRQIIKIIFVLVVVAAFTILLWQRQTPNEGSLPVPNNSLPTVGTQIDINTSSYSRELDQDMDGIVDADEEALGTSNGSFDTDNDGLSDWDETAVWKTNPTMVDTDADGFPDGVEVGRGYNPTGSGRF